MTLNESAYSSTRMDWQTPDDLFETLDREFRFTTDVAATSENRRCANYLGPGRLPPNNDALSVSWSGVCWLNPPYGRDIKMWIRKAYEESVSGATVVCLVPSRTDSRWWHDYAMRGEIRFLTRRLTFKGAGNKAPFPASIVVFRPGQHDQAYKVVKV